VESVSKGNARQPAIQRPYSTIHIQYAYNLTFKKIRDHITYSYSTIDLAKAFHTNCLIHLIKQYGLFMLYLSQKLTYSEYTAETDIKVLNTVLLRAIALR